MRELLQGVLQKRGQGLERIEGEGGVAVEAGDVDVAAGCADPVRAGGDTKTKTSRRTLALPQRCVDALREQRDRQAAARELAGPRWQDHDLVFASEVGTELDAANVRRGFRRIIAAAGLDATTWTPRELRHSFVSLLSDEGVAIERIARLVGHTGGSAVTEKVYRKQLRPIIDDGATTTNERPGPELL